MAKVTKELEKLRLVVSSVGYQQKAKDSVKAKHIDQVRIRSDDVPVTTILIMIFCRLSSWSCR